MISRFSLYQLVNKDYGTHILKFLQSPGLTSHQELVVILQAFSLSWISACFVVPFSSYPLIYSSFRFCVGARLIWDRSCSKEKDYFPKFITLVGAPAPGHRRQKAESRTRQPLFDQETGDESLSWDGGRIWSLSQGPGIRLGSSLD